MSTTGPALYPLYPCAEWKFQIKCMPAQARPTTAPPNRNAITSKHPLCTRNTPEEIRFLPRYFFFRSYLPFSYFKCFILLEYENAPTIRFNGLMCVIHLWQFSLAILICRQSHCFTLVIFLLLLHFLAMETMLLASLPMEQEGAGDSEKKKK